MTSESPKTDVASIMPSTATVILDYYYNDPSDDLHGILTIPPLPPNTPEFTVVGWKGMPNVIAGTPAYQAAQVWGTIASTLYYIMNLKVTPNYIKEWAATYNLVAIPRAGNQLNAYYDRSSLRFFWGKDPKTNTTVYTCDAVGIVAHELGHAILDAIRPDLWNTAVLEFFAFHEAFGDILALSSILQHDAVINQMLVETTTSPSTIPDLWQSNVVSQLAQQLGHAIYYTSKMTIGAEKYLRNVFNDFKYVDPLTLAQGASDAVLTQEPHNFSRVFSGAWYECFCELFKASYNPSEVLIGVKKTRDTMVCALFDAVLIVPSQLRFFQAVATTMIDVLVKQNKHQEAEIVTKVFKRRNLFGDQITQVAAPNVSTVNIDSDAPKYYIRASIVASLTRPVETVNVELPKYVAMTKDKDPITNLSIEEVLKTSANGFLNYISSQGLLGNDNDNMFCISDGKLVRNYICSSFRATPQILPNNVIGQIAH